MVFYILMMMRLQVINLSDTFDGFETWVLENKMVHHMTSLGRKVTINAFVVTGNGNGLAGFALGKASELKAALKTAKNRAGQRLLYIPRYKEHTGKKIMLSCDI